MTCDFFLVPPPGLEPGRLTATDFKSVMSTYSIKEALVSVERFELPTLWSQTRCATRLRYTELTLSSIFFVTTFFRFIH